MSVASMPENAAAVSPSNTVDLTDVSKALYIASTGTLTVDMADTGTTILFTAVSAGVLPLSVKRVRVTGTTVTGIVNLF